MRLGFSFIFLFISIVASAGFSWAQDLTLDELFNLAKEHSPILATAKAQEERQDGMLTAARSGFLPNLSVGLESSRLGDSRLDNTINNQELSRDNWQADVLLQQKIDISGKISATTKKASNLKQAAKDRFRTVDNHLRFLIKEKFIMYIASRQKEAVFRKLLNLLEKEIRIEKERFQAGLSPKMHILRAKVAYSNANSRYISTKNSSNKFKIELFELVGVVNTLDVENTNLTGQLTEEIKTFNQSDLLKWADKNRVELKRIKKLIEASKNEISAQKSRYLPDVSLYAGYSFRKDRLTEDYFDKQSSWKAGVSVKWSIFDGFETKGLVKAARAENALRKSQYQEQSLSMEQEVIIAHQKLKEAQELVENSKSSFNKSNKVLLLMKNRFSIGKSNQSEVLQAHVSNLESQLNQLDAVYRLNMSYCLIERATGVYIDSV